MGSNVYVFRTVFLDENFGPLLKKKCPAGPLFRAKIEVRDV